MKTQIHHLKTPTQVKTTSLNIPDNYRNQCIQEAYKIGDKQNHQTNIKGIMSSYRVWEETKVFNQLLDNILIVSIGLDSPDNPLYFVNAWFAIYKKGHHTIPHIHSPAYLSFVYYLKADNKSSPLVFDNSDFFIKPKNDLLILFPSYMPHSVPIQNEGEDRICIAGNFMFNSDIK